MWTRKDELDLINKTQNEYVALLKDRILAEDGDDEVLRFVNFTAPTGSGKTIMMARLMNGMADTFFVVTTLSKGQLAHQIRDNLAAHTEQDNFVVFGTASLKSNTLFTEDDLTDILDQHDGQRIVWLRDEGHIASNNWAAVLEKRCFKIVNISATNKHNTGIVCNFTHTMMLRTVHQQEGTINDALKQLLSVKKRHKVVSGYNPCAVFRIVSEGTEDAVQKACQHYGLSYISLVDNDDYDMQKLCMDDCRTDVIINKQKVVEGIDIRRAHVIWIENEPANSATTIQLVGRCRRNALLWRDDIDILAPENEELLEATRQCYAFYNVKSMRIDTDENGELAVAFCPYVSVEQLKTGSSVYVDNGQMKNGLFVSELAGQTGTFEIRHDDILDVNYVNNPEYYKNRFAISGITVATFELLNHLRELNTWLILQDDEWWASAEKMFRQHYRKRLACIDCIRQDGHVSKLVGGKMRGLGNGFTRWLCIVYNGKQYAFTESEFACMLRDHSFSVTDLSPFRWEGLYTAFTAVTNDDELAKLSGDTYACYKGENEKDWQPQLSLTAKMAQASKLSRFIENKYKNGLEKITKKFYTGTVKRRFPKKLHTVLGYCVKYYAKYAVCGESFMLDCVKKAEDEAKGGRYSRDAVIIRACLLKYRQDMLSLYGQDSAKKIRTASLDTIKSSRQFMDTVIRYGKRAADFIVKHCNSEFIMRFDPRLITATAIGLINVTDGETLIEIKCSNHIDKAMVKQALACAYLSQYRSDLNIKRVYVYDAVKDKAVSIKVNCQPVKRLLPATVNQFMTAHPFYGYDPDGNFYRDVYDMANNAYGDDTAEALQGRDEFVRTALMRFHEQAEAETWTLFHTALATEHNINYMAELAAMCQFLPGCIKAFKQSLRRAPYTGSVSKRTNRLMRFTADWIHDHIDDVPDYVLRTMRDNGLQDCIVRDCPTYEFILKLKDKLSFSLSDTSMRRMPSWVGQKYTVESDGRSKTVVWTVYPYKTTAKHLIRADVLKVMKICCQKGDVSRLSVEPACRLSCTSQSIEFRFNCKELKQYAVGGKTHNASYIVTLTVGVKDGVRYQGGLFLTL